MNENRPTDAHMNGWEKEMAELDNRLRLFVAPADPDAVPWPVVARLGVQTSLLVGVGLDRERPDLVGAIQALRRLLETSQERPGSLPPGLEDVLEATSGHLGGLMADLDGGRDLAEALADPAWDRLRQRYRDLDTPLGVFNNLHDQLLAWQEAWCDRSLTPEEEKTLQERWRQLRGLADALFDPAPEGASGDDEPGLLRWQGFDSEK